MAVVAPTSRQPRRPRRRCGGLDHRSHVCPGRRGPPRLPADRSATRSSTAAPVVARTAAASAAGWSISRPTSSSVAASAVRRSHRSSPGRGLRRGEGRRRGRRDRCRSHAPSWSAPRCCSATATVDDLGQPELDVIGAARRRATVQLLHRRDPVPGPGGRRRRRGRRARRSAPRPGRPVARRRSRSRSTDSPWRPHRLGPRSRPRPAHLVHHRRGRPAGRRPGRVVLDVGLAHSHGLTCRSHLRTATPRPGRRSRQSSVHPTGTCLGVLDRRPAMASTIRPAGHASTAAVAATALGSSRRHWSSRRHLDRRGALRSGIA